MTERMRVLREAVWRYAGSVELPDRVIARDWEWLREADDPDLPALDADGWAYYVRFGRVERDAAGVSSEAQGEFAPTARLLNLDRYQSPRDLSLSADEAIAAAERAAPGIRWARDGSPAA
jgi:hypothetical protein